MSVTIDDFKKIFSDLSDTFTDKKEYLIKMDSVMGDGDLGITMSRIFTAASENIQSFEGDSLGKMLMTAGMIMAKTAPSTMGTLMASAFMDAGKQIKNKNDLNVSDWALFFDGMQGGIAKRGKASVGEKTILDVLNPVSEYLKGKNYSSHKALFTDLCSYASACLKKTEDMEAQHGKAACFGEKSRGHVDAGATVAYLLIETLAQYFDGTEESSNL